MSRIKFGILGGDYRYKILYDMLKKDGYEVKAYLNKEISETNKNIEELIKGIDALITPIPCTKDKENVFLPDNEGISFDKIFKLMNKDNGKLLFGGVIPKEIKIKAMEYDIKGFDYFEQEAVAVLNAIPTAEGAIQTAMQESESCLFSSKALVLGYGRCGKILSNMLKGIGAKVTVSFRNEKDEAYITAYGFESINLNNLECSIGSYDFIFNTIPANILNRKLLKLVNKATIIIDLAQAPGGLDYSFARDINLKALYCPGLPGRIAPYTAAEILKNTILNICLSQLAWYFIL